nr:hypothetical protein [Candidatus Woesearchaeota archaeon]
MAIKKIKITVSSLKESFEEDRKFFADIDNGIFKKYTPEINFESFKTYKKFLTPKRLELLKVIKLRKPKNIKELSEITKRDFKNIYEDVKILETLDLLKLKKSDSGLKPIVNYDEINMNIKIPLQAKFN